MVDIAFDEQTKTNNILEISSFGNSRLASQPFTSEDMISRRGGKVCH